MHDVHIWSIAPEMNSMGYHFLVDDVPTSEAGRIRENIKKLLGQQFNIEQATLKIECEQCDVNDVLRQPTLTCKKDEDKKRLS